ncbi:hypothetical protein QCA50_017872 [Cerrena zonata]|uniref:Major facilitator superfamily (MFS) profile domain-containing protein n=1 Tax=Cerrena zonata TaxID=2478898 RepID=A0AAW0FIE3_9APHY
MATRDLPKSFRDLAIGWIEKIPKEVTITPAGRLRLRSQIEQKELEHRERARENGEIDDDDDELTRKNMGKVNKKNLWNAFVSGAGLFSDGESTAISNISAIVFVGTIVGQLSFGYISDHMSRKQGMMIANTMLIIFTLLCAVGTWGKNGSPQGLFAALTVFRFFLGIAIGAEYPTSSVIASEFANELPADYIGPRLTIAGALVIQSSISFAMASHYPTLKKHIASFVVVFGFQQTFEVVTMLSLLQVGKIGAFVGTYIFPIIMRNARKVSADWEMQAPFFVSAALCMFSAFLALFLCPTVDQDAIDNEDAAFIAYLKDQGYDLHNMGDGTVLEVVDDETSEEEAVKNKQDVQVDTNSKKSL